MKNYIHYITQNSILSEQEAIWLLEHILKDKSKIYHTKLNNEQESILNEYLNQINKQHKPLAYIIGWVPFLDLKINVRPPILIPRPETEEWVNNLITKLTTKKDSIKKILDIGTGSGAIALSLAHTFKNAEVLALDINPDALKLAQENADINSINNIQFLKSDLFQAIKYQKFDLIVSNPPYIPETAEKNISATVLNWEDKRALFSGKEGLDIIEKILKNAHHFINDNKDLDFQLVLEIDDSQAKSIKTLAENNNWNCFLQQDLFKKNRTAWCKNA